ncbi:MAG: hypothetical protein ACTSPY_04815 [Candidatus Helarchaeota archaeon]
MSDNKKNVFINDIFKLSNKDLSVLFIVPVILTLFFIEALRAYVPGIYEQLFHVVFQDSGWELSLMSLLTMILFAIPLFSRMLSKKMGVKKTIFISTIIIVVSRLLMAFRISAIIEVVLSGIIVGFYGMYVGTFLGFLLTHETKLNNISKVGLYIITFIVGVLIDLLIRTIGFTTDISLITWPIDILTWYNYQYLWLIIQFPLSIIVILLHWKFWNKCTADYKPIEIDADKEKKGKNLIALISGMTLGIFLFLQFNIMLYPNAISQFTSTDYLIINVIVISVITLTCIILLTINEKIITNLGVMLFLNSFLMVGFAIFLYFGHTLGMVSAVLMAISISVMYFDIYAIIKFSGTCGKKGNKVRMLSNVFAIAFGIFLLFSFLYDFTTDWSFIIKSFRYWGPPILIISAVILICCVVIAIIYNKKEMEK